MNLVLSMVYSAHRKNTRAWYSTMRPAGQQPPACLEQQDKLGPTECAAPNTIVTIDKVHGMQCTIWESSCVRHAWCLELNCSHLPFHTMPVHRQDGTDVVVICTQFVPAAGERGKPFLNPRRGRRL